MKCIVHIGTEKTGTTTIQHILYNNKTKLEAQGFYYPTSPGEINHRMFAAYSINKDKILNDDFFKHQSIDHSNYNHFSEKFRLDFANEMNSLNKENIKNVIISNEHLHSRLKEIEEVKRFRSMIGNYFNEIEILVYLRRQDLVCVSLYSTAMKVGHFSKFNFPREISHYYNYYSLISKWASVFGKKNMIIRIFDKSKFINNNLIDDFKNAVSLDQIDLNHSDHHNPSLNIRAIEFLRILNHYGLNDRCRQLVIKHLEKNYQGKGFIPNINEAKDFVSKFNISNHLLANEFLNRETLFNNDFSNYEQTKDDFYLSHIEFLEILTEIFPEYSGHIIKKDFQNEISKIITEINLNYPVRL